MQLSNVKLPVSVVSNVADYAAMCGLTFDEALADLATKSLNRINAPRLANRPAFSLPAESEVSHAD